MAYKSEHRTPLPARGSELFALNVEVKRILIDGYKIIPPESVYKIYTDMETKYVQKVIPRVSTERYNRMTAVSGTRYVRRNFLL